MQGHIPSSEAWFEGTASPQTLLLPRYNLGGILLGTIGEILSYLLGSDNFHTS